MIAEDLNIFDLAPHREESVSKVLTSNESILNKILPGDYIRFMKNVGGGGGHRLHVKDFCAIIEMFSEWIMVSKNYLPNHLYNRCQNQIKNSLA